MNKWPFKLPGFFPPDILGGNTGSLIDFKVETVPRENDTVTFYRDRFDGPESDELAYFTLTPVYEGVRDLSTGNYLISTDLVRQYELEAGLNIHTQFWSYRLPVFQSNFVEQTSILQSAPAELFKELALWLRAVAFVHNKQLWRIEQHVADSLNLFVPQSSGFSTLVYTDPIRVIGTIHADQND